MKIINKLAVFGVVLLLIGCSKPVLEDRLADKSIFRGVAFVGMTVSDAQSAKAFYDYVFGLAEDTSSSEIPNGLLPAGAENGSTYTSAVLRSTNAQLMLFDFPERDGRENAVAVQGPGIAHVCYQMDKRLAAYQKALEKGATHIGDIDMVKLSPMKPVEYAYVHDHDGIMFEVEHVDMEKLGDEVRPSVDRRIRHVSFATSDIDRLVGFYAKFMGVKKPRRADKLSSSKVDKVSGLPDSELSMGWIQVGNLELEFVQYHSHPVDPRKEPRSIDSLGYNMIVLDVADVSRATELLLAAGGTLLPTGEGRDSEAIVFGRDIDGNLLGMANFPENSRFSADSFEYQY